MTDDFVAAIQDFAVRHEIPSSTSSPTSARRTSLASTCREWAWRQLDRRRIRYQALDDGFRSCADPEALQNVCHSLGTDDVDAYFRRWLKHLPHPFTANDRDAGYRYQPSILQMEVSLTQVFDRPVHPTTVVSSSRRSFATTSTSAAPTSR